jgi:RimJ/RimL family protein N-acetyltransferase
MHAGFHGRGLATEAARAMLELGFGELGLRRVTAELDSRNAASARLLEGLGFTLHRRFATEFKGEQTEDLEYVLEKHSLEAPGSS